MTTEQKCMEILQRIHQINNEEDKPVTLTSDWGGNSMAVHVGQSHTHVGETEASFEDMINGLHSVLHGGPGLSWFDAGLPNNADSV